MIETHPRDTDDNQQLQVATDSLLPPKGMALTSFVSSSHNSKHEVKSASRFLITHMTINSSRKRANGQEHK